MSGPRRDALAHGGLLALAAWCAWRPAETSPSTAIVIGAVVLSLLVWGWRRTPGEANRWLTAAAVGAILAASGMTGWDPASAIGELALLAAVASLVWLASRVAPPGRWPALLGLAISALTLWGLWQVTGGLERVLPAVSELPEEMQAAAIERLRSGRAFASQIVPSHFAALLATALPLLLARLRRRRSAVPWAVGTALCVIGLVISRSPVGAALALAASTAVVFHRRKRLLASIIVLLTLVLVVVVVGRGDVQELEPVRLRFDNWRSAVWVWSTAPAAGAGFGGFAQAAQAVPFEVGNRPRHAHSLPLEWLAELGPIGLLAVALLALVLWRLIRDVWPERPDLAAAVAVIPVHNLVDFSLYGSGVALPWAVLVGWTAAMRRQSGRPSREPARGRFVLVAAAAAALAVTVLHVTSIVVEASAASRPTPDERLAAAIDARRLAPWRVEPLGLIAAAALETGDQTRIADAIAGLERSRWLRPRSAALAGLRSQLAIAVGSAPSAVSEAWTSTFEQPTNETHAANFEALLDRLEPGAGDEHP
jgi:hypothetical protein